ncbi:hypothetical protein LCGC14_0518140 [marine sediment metagenome]|uniref:Uncharacterized protein n=1 Tax=marine sediment metagenome TaxID=412755 RepID=A0A0F9V7M0_9ZZZZ|nr:MAG: hypothetical protein Lokiarch_47770 [Candidatus Lokiarchaeum sp. GC14_75]
MTQAYKQLMEMKSIEVEEIEQPEIQESMESEVDELLGDLNPRYFEEAISLKEVKTRIYAAKSYSNYSFNTFGF